MAQPRGAVFNLTTTNKQNITLKFCKHFCLVFKVVVMVLALLCGFFQKVHKYKCKQHKQTYITYTNTVFQFHFSFQFHCLASVQQQQHPSRSYESIATADCNKGRTHLRSDTMACDGPRPLSQVCFTSKVDVQHSRLPDSRSCSCIEQKRKGCFSLS